MKKILELLDTVRPHCSEAVEVNGKTGWCGKTAVFRVEWSDRGCCVCPEHLDQARHWAANDNSGDRTDDPYIYDICDEKVAADIDAALASLEVDRSDTARLDWLNGPDRHIHRRQCDLMRSDPCVEKQLTFFVRGVHTALEGTDIRALIDEASHMNGCLE